MRVAGLKQQIESDVVERSADGRTATRDVPGDRQARAADDRRSSTAAGATNSCRRSRRMRSSFSTYDKASVSDREFLEDYYHRQVRPVLTPLGIDPAHPFPQLLNKSLNIVVQLEIERNGETQRRLAVVQVPRVLPRLVSCRATTTGRTTSSWAHLIGHYLADLFPGTTILGFWHFRVTRNSELYIDEEDVGNLLSAVEQELHNRRKGAAVRLEVDARLPVGDLPVPARDARPHDGRSLHHRRAAQSHPADGDL